jgi:mannose-6-phosphate isomerase
LAELQGRAAPSDDPEAELWMGAHSSAPSRLELPQGERPLCDVIAEDPVGTLGDAALGEFGPRLPFLLKVLAASEPLSLQAHPSPEQARAGFADEDARGVPRDAPTRNYRDECHKPELLCALTPFDALCGFRDLQQARALLSALQIAELDGYAAQLTDSVGLRSVFDTMYGLPKSAAADLTTRVVAACQAHCADAQFGDSYVWACKLHDKYSGDIGVVTSLLLNLVRLSPGEAIYLPAGNLHAYLKGAGVEIMASSDNVLRGGLTVKHVDVPELMRVLDFRPMQVQLAATTQPDSGRIRYITDAREFCLEQIALSGELKLPDAARGPEIWLCHSGTAELCAAGAQLRLLQAESCFVPAGAGPTSLRGNAVLFRALVGALA